MPRIKLTLNIGTKDAGRLGLPETKEGSVVSVSSEVADELRKRGWGVDPGARTLDPAARPTNSATPPPLEGHVAPAGVEAVEGSESDADADAESDDNPDLDAMTKAELVEFAQGRGIEGVTMAMNKDEMVSRIEDHLTR